MYPAIREGETITVQPVASSTVKKGDIILYRWQRGVIAHRVVGVEKFAGGSFRLIMRGDASGAPIERVAADQVLGRVVAVDRNGRRIDLCSIRSKMQRILHPIASQVKKWTLQKRTPRR
jgi:signal peptidase I